MTADLPPTPIQPGLRDRWMLKQGVAFLNHGSFGALPREVFEAQEQWRRRIEAEPIEILGRQCAALIEEAKAPVGKWLGMRTQDFGFVANATEGINAVLRQFPLSAGDELLTTDHVYHAVRQTMRFAAGRAGATLREAPVKLPAASADQIADAVIAAISSRTRLLVVDHVTSPTGLVFPVQRIIDACRERGVETLIDGAHAPGMLPLNIEKLGATYYAANLHKWACGPKGCALIWVRPDRQTQVHPTTISHFLDEGFAREFGWQGTRDISAWLTLPAALKFMANLGWDKVMDHNHALAAWAHRMLCDRLGVSPLSPPDGSLLGSTASVSLPAPLNALSLEQLNALQRRLYHEYQIELPLMRWNEHVMLRVSCQVYNTADEYLKLAESMARVAAHA